MTRKKWDLVLLAGVLCFLVGGPSVVFGYLETPWEHALGALGLVLIGAGLLGKRRTSNHPKV